MKNAVPGSILIGVVSVGLVAPLFPPDVVMGEKWDVIQANAEKVIGNVKAAMA